MEFPVLWSVLFNVPWFGGIKCSKILLLKIGGYTKHKLTIVTGKKHERNTDRSQFIMFLSH